MHTPVADEDLPGLSIRCHDAGHDRWIVVLTLDDPQRRNAMSETMTRSWETAIRRLVGRPEVAAVVVTGAGTAFCSGGALEWLAGGQDAVPEDLRRRMAAFYDTWLSIGEIDAVTIAAVQGAAIGAGLALALACDVRYVADGARLGAPFTALGIHPGMGITWWLPEVAGIATARDMLLTGRMLTGEEAVRRGMASWSGPAERVLPEALAAAGRVAGAAPVATALTTAVLRGGGHGDLPSALRWEALAQGVTMTTEDVHEGVAAAQERRPPVFRGR